MHWLKVEKSVVPFGCAVLLIFVLQCGAAETNVPTHHPIVVDQADAGFFQNARIISQIFTGALATMIAVVAACFILWLTSSFQSVTASSPALPSRSLWINVLKHLGRSIWMVLIVVTPYIVFGFYPRWFLAGGGGYLLLRIGWQIVRERAYLKQINAESPHWSAMEEMAVSASLKEKAEQERLAIQAQEAALLDAAKARRQEAEKAKAVAPPAPPAHQPAGQRPGPIRVQLPKKDRPAP